MTDVYDLMVQLGDRKLVDRMTKARMAGSYTTTPTGAYLAGAAAGEMVRIMEKLLAREGGRGRPSKTSAAMRDMIRTLGTERIAALSARYLVDTLSQGEKHSATLRINLGRILEDEAQMMAVAKLAPKPYRYNAKFLKRSGRKFKSKARGIYAYLASTVPDDEQQNLVAWDPKAREALGAIMVSLMVQHSGIIESRYAFKAGRKAYQMLRLKDSTKDWMKEAEEAARQICPLSLPLMEPPDPWIDPMHGGFHKDFVGRRPLISSDHRVHTKVMMSAECPEVYDAINIMQQTKWAINKKVLEVFRTAIRNRWSADSLRMPNYEAVVIPECPTEDKEDARYKIWRRELRQAKERESSNKLRAHQVSRIEYLATVYENDPLYFVHMLDFRGRAYPLGGGLAYQGDDRQRGLLQFATGLPIRTAIAKDWYYIHGANVWGADKLPFADRIGWVERNIGMILDIARDPIQNRSWIDADKPWQFLAWCFDFHGYYADPDNYLSHIPVGMDGSNNGLQLYSLLLRDPVGGKATNCTPGDAPQDIYMEVAAVVNKYLRAARYDMALEHKHRKWAAQLLDFWPEGLPRAAVKRPVMTLPYGSTQHSCQHYLAEWYHDEVRGKRLEPPPFPDMDSYDALVWVGKLLWKAIGEVVIAARECMDWLRAVSDIVVAAGKTPAWTNPVGFPVVQRYQKGTREVVRLRLDRDATIWHIGESPIADARKHRNAIAPNFIHSLDAALMVRTVNRADQHGVKDFMMIHDSFATHAANAGVLADVIRDEAVRMFSEDILGDLRDQLQEIVGDAFVLPPPPATGTLDITGLLESRYFFA